MSELISRFEQLNLNASTYRTEAQASRHSDFNYLYEPEDSSYRSETRNKEINNDEDSDIEGKLFVGGISWQTTEEGLSIYFSQFGALVDVALMKDKYTGQPRGFGFIKFEDSSVIDRVLSQREHCINGRAVDVKRAVKKSDAPGPVKSIRPMDTNKIFVGGLAPSVSVLEFRQYFERFGTVLDAVVMFDRQTQRSRGFGFVTFQDENVVQVVLMALHEINGKIVEVKHAEPKDCRRNVSLGAINKVSSPYRGVYFHPLSSQARQSYRQQHKLSNPYAYPDYTMYNPAVGDAYLAAYEHPASPYHQYSNPYFPYGGSYVGNEYVDDSYVTGGFPNSETEYMTSPSTAGRSSQYQSLLSNYGTGRGIPASSPYLDYDPLRNQLHDSSLITSSDRKEETEDYSLKY